MIDELWPRFGIDDEAAVKLRAGLLAEGLSLDDFTLGDMVRILHESDLRGKAGDNIIHIDGKLDVEYLDTGGTLWFLADEVTDDNEG